MGFLDFLKKDKSKGSPFDGDTPEIDLDEVSKKIGAGAEPPAPPADKIPPPPASPNTPPSPPDSTMKMPSKADNPDDSPMSDVLQYAQDTPSVRDDIQADDEPPLPPPELKEHDFLQDAMDETEGKTAAKQDAMQARADRIPPDHEEWTRPPKHPDVPLPKATIPKPEPKKEVPQKPDLPKKEEKIASVVDLPDFTDEDIESIEPKETKPEPKDPPKKKGPVIPEPSWVPQKAEPATPNETDDVKPLEGHASFKSLQPAMFLASDMYFEIKAEIRKTRSQLRDNDKLLTTAVSDHEKCDDQLDKFAGEINDIHEGLISLDEALFEE